ncbi:hypothetical protein [Mesorhizobium temperatum]|uniref:hypothetical protein n=1 Tax=Mesorhizobium temperatum TaxID=241416 RepID=UPI003CC9AC97
MTSAEECCGQERRLYPQRCQLPFHHDRLCHDHREPEAWHDLHRFTSRYGVQRLAQREKSLKRWLRQWKIDLIEKTNPEWFELFRGTGW